MTKPPMLVENWDGTIVEMEWRDSVAAVAMGKTLICAYCEDDVIGAWLCGDNDSLLMLCDECARAYAAPAAGREEE